MRNINKSVDDLFRQVGRIFEDLTDALHLQPSLGSFEKTCISERYSVSGCKDICIESRGYGHWAITHWNNVLAKDGEWEYEPLPSSRNDEFIKRTRWNSAQAAFEFLKSWKRTEG